MPFLLGVQTCALDRKSTRLNSSHQLISYAVFCLKKTKIRWGGHLLLGYEPVEGARPLNALPLGLLLAVGRLHLLKGLAFADTVITCFFLKIRASGGIPFPLRHDALPL